MKILALEKEVIGTTEEQFRPHLKDEARRVWELQQKEVIREIYFTKDTNEAVVIMECNDENEALNVLATLPLVKEKLIFFEIKPLIAYNGYERLFEK
jgi:hypothetical protein